MDSDNSSKRLYEWMTQNGFVDKRVDDSFEDLLSKLSWQVQDLRNSLLEATMSVEELSRRD